MASMSRKMINVRARSVHFIWICQRRWSPPGWRYIYIYMNEDESFDKMWFQNIKDIIDDTLSKHIWSYMYTRKTIVNDIHIYFTAMASDGSTLFRGVAQRFSFSHAQQLEVLVIMEPWKQLRTSWSIKMHRFRFTILFYW